MIRENSLLGSDGPANEMVLTRGAPSVRPMSATQEQSVVEVTVDDDRMKAWLHCVKDADPAAITQEQVQSAVQSAGIALVDRVTARITDYLKQLDSGTTPSDKFLIAEGREPQEPQDGTFEWAAELSEPPIVQEEEAQIDFYDINSIRSVTEGTVIGTITSPKKGGGGVDVLGNTIKPKRRASSIEVGPNIQLLDDGTAVSETHGQVVFKYNHLSVEEMIKISGDVDFECGNLDVPCDIHIRGTVLSQFEVKSEKSITVGGRVQAAQVEAGKNVVVREGILGGNKGKVTAGGGISTRFCEDADLQASGDITIASDAVNSKLSTEGQVLADRATIIGGTVHANRGVVVGTLGSQADVLTLVTVGIQATGRKPSDQSTSGDVAEELQQEKDEAESTKIAKLESTVKTIRQLLLPTMDHPERLSEDHRKQIAQLLGQAENIEEEIKRRLRIQDDLSETGPPLGTADIVVNKTIHPKVVLTIDDRRSRFTKTLKGPVRIEKRKLKNVSELVAVNLLTGSITRLQSERLT